MTKKILKIILTIFVLLSLFSCNDNELQSNIDETFYIPEPANKFAIDKETEVETIEPTLAHRPYPENFELKPANEIVIGEKEFLTKINYIYNNIELFDKTKFIVEGMYGIYTSWDETFQSVMVYRNGPAEYGDDQYGGFYLLNVPLDDNLIDEWIKVKGTAYMHEHTDSEGEIQKFLFL